MFFFKGGFFFSRDVLCCFLVKGCSSFSRDVFVWFSRDELSSRDVLFCFFSTDVIVQGMCFFVRDVLWFFFQRRLFFLFIKGCAFVSRDVVFKGRCCFLICKGLFFCFI